MYVYIFISQSRYTFISFLDAPSFALVFTITGRTVAFWNRFSRADPNSSAGVPKPSRLFGGRLDRSNSNVKADSHTHWAVTPFPGSCSKAR